MRAVAGTGAALAYWAAYRKTAESSSGTVMESAFDSTLGSLQATLPEGLAAILISDQLGQRVGRTPDYKAESDALALLASRMAEAPQTILIKLVETALALCKAGSAGISIAEADGAAEVFRWHALAGQFAPYVGETLPRHFSPCGVVLDTNATQLMCEPVRYFTAIAGLPHIVEALLIPFYRGKQAIGTVWVISHDAARHFDAEDARIMLSLSKFASAATQTLSAIRNAQALTRSLQDAQGRIEATLEAGMVGTWVWDVQTDRVWGDRNLTRLFGIDPVLADGTALADYTKQIVEEDRPKVAAAFDRALREGTFYEVEYRVNVSDGSIHWVVGRGHAQFDNSGTATGFSGVVIDITDRKQQEAVSSGLYEKLEESVRQKDEFLAVLSHELRGPLGSVSMAVDVLQRSQDPNHAKNAVATIRRQCDQLTRLVEDLLDSARIRTGKLTLDLRPVDVEDAVQMAVETSQATLGKFVQELVTIKPSAPVRVRADVVRLAQVIHNLLSNASKNSPRGSEIAILWGVEGDKAVVRVRDQGIGIAPENLERIFGIFEQINPTGLLSGDGLGVGLALAKRLVELQGGTIAAFSEGAAQGAEFVVTLPLDSPVTPS